MKTIKISDLTPGVIFDKPVYLDGENLLLPANIPLRTKDLERLKRWDIAEVRTDGEPINPTSSARDPQVFQDLFKGGPSTELLKKYTEAVKTLDAAFESLRNNRAPKAADINKIVESLLPAIRDHTDSMVAFTIHLAAGGSTSLAESSVNCMILSTVIGLILKLPPQRLLQLAIGALLHDIGMTKVPTELLEKTDNLSEEELNVIHRHTLFSYSYVTKVLKYPEEIGQIVLQHHERWDGKGYPRGLEGEHIALPARIVSLTDSFEAMVRDRPYRNSMIGYSAMRQVLNDNSRRFDSEILKVFIKSMGIYPIGSIVLLNDGSIGRVIRIHGDAPLRPTIRLIVDKDGRKVGDTENLVNDLLEEKSLFIAKAINPTDVNARSK